MVDNEVIAALSKNVALLSTIDLVAGVQIEAFLSIGHAMGNCWMRVGLQGCARAARVERWLIFVACVMIRLLAHDSDVGLRCTSDVRVQLVYMSRLTSVLHATATRLRMYVDRTLCSRDTERGWPKRMDGTECHFVI